MQTPYIFDQIYAQFFSFFKSAFGGVVSQDFGYVLTIITVLKILGGIFSILMIAGIVHNVWRLTLYSRKQLSEILESVFEPAMSPERASRWSKIKEAALGSDNPSGWKAAIIDADNIVDDILKKAGYGGANLGERLLKVKRYMFKNTLNLFRAHIFCNKISGNGNGAGLTKEKTMEILGLYEEALKELGYLES